MINRILVATDFSDGANNALCYALGIAEHARAEIHLLHSGYIPVPNAYFTAVSYSDIMDSIEANAKLGFEKIKDKYFKDASKKFVSSTAFGMVSETVQEYVNRHKIDLVVMGTLGGSKMDDILIGSNTAAVVRSSTIPVMVVPLEAVYKGFHHIVYATDNYGPEFPVVSKLIYFADMFGAQMHVVTAETDFEKYLKPDDNFFVRNKENLSIKKWEVKKVFSEYVLESIDKFVNEKHADLLVMSKHKRDFFSRLLHRSLSKRMIHHTKVPLMVLGQSVD